MYITFVYFSTPIHCILQTFLPLLHKSLYFEYIVNHNPLICCSYFSGLSSLLHCMQVISWLLHFLQREIRLQWKEQFVGMAICTNFFINLRNTVKIFLGQKKIYSEWQLQWKIKKKRQFWSFIWNLEVFQLYFSAFVILIIGPKWLNKPVSRPLFSFEKHRFWNLWKFAWKMKSSFCVVYCERKFLPNASYVSHSVT